MNAAAPALAPDLAAGLRRLKLAAMRQLAPELLVTAHFQLATTADHNLAIDRRPVTSRAQR